MAVWPVEKRSQSVAAWLAMLDVEPQISTPSSTKLRTKPKIGPNGSTESVDWAKWGVIVTLIVGLVPFVTWLVDKIDMGSEDQVPEASTIEPTNIEESSQVPDTGTSEMKPISPDATP